MQATVHRFEPEEGAGMVLLDTGRALPFSAEVFAGSELRHLRLGQRVSIEVTPTDPEEPAARVQRLWIVGIGADQPIR